MPNINETKRIVKRIMLTNLLVNDHSIALTPLISGKHGIGKSQIARKIAEELNGVSITIEGGTLKEGEITGIPYQHRNEKGEAEFRFLPYYAIDRIQKAQKELARNKCEKEDLADILNGDENIYEDEDLTLQDKFSRIINKEVKPVILFFDEINRTDVSVFRELMNIILTRTVNGYRLPWWVFIMAAINPGTRDGYYATNDMDPAQLDRFIKIKTREDADEWLTYAAGAGVDETIMKFIASSEESLSLNEKDLIDDNMPEPTPRGWNMVDLILKGKDKLNIFFSKEELKYKDRDIKNIIFAKLGNETASMYYSSLNNDTKLVLAKDIFRFGETGIHPDVIKMIKKQSTSKNSITSRSIVSWFKENVDSNRIDETNFNKVLKKIGQYLNAIDPSSRLYFAESAKSVMTRHGGDILDLIIDIFDDEMLELLQLSNMNEMLVSEE